MKYLVIGIVFIIVSAGGFYLINNSQPTPESTAHMDHAALVTDDKTFIEGMIPHHEEAIASSQEIIKTTKNPEIKKLAQDIIIAQEKEVAEMTEWYETWFSIAYKDTGTYKPMMRPIAEKSTEEAEQMYLQDMINHHKAAVMMAQAILPITKREEIKVLSNNIITSQNKEITLMQSLIKKELPKNTNTHQEH